MNDETLIATLGRCWAFPPQFSAQSGVKMAAGNDAVFQSLQILFSTQPGERIMRESWGAGMNDFLFENVTDALLAKIQTRIEETILRYESRVVLKEVVIQPVANEASRLQIAISVYLSGSDITGVINGTLDLNESQTLRLL
ncbi:GPW/gp25 family protein [Erwinia persicina]|uniref:GPW/gp25 family protein n=1 Tax=Erwinia persicina TaxID=55211 RepID=A0A4U3EUX3_9GAMM|nr:GPW/gp25 family protein [Erwinia persicina]MBD8109117.1 GPW/gp25 family protein [Erwinia persicina]MBD8170105.1 GPW/gp25 family protein [Erwinia persicina]MBD8212241.1 GPW/gp25 family protein [Erwinia persicina]TKJ83636.1 phage baseplate protein [Erwinia persicina]